MHADNEPSQDTLNEWHNDPSNWVFGVFYFNKKDHRIFPPKRLAALGRTVNFANPYSVLIVTGVLVLIAAAASL